MNFHAAIATAGVFIVAIIGSVFLFSSPSTAANSYCSLTPLNSSVIKVECFDSEGNKIPPAELDISGVTSNIVTVIVRETNEVIKTVIKRVLVPGPTKTIRITKGPRPRDTKTVRVPGREVTLPPVRITETVTERATITPRPTATETVEVRGNIPTDTITVTETPSSSTRQNDNPRARIGSSENTDRVNFRDGKTTVEEVGIGALSLLILMAIVLLGLYSGYVLGYKDSARKDTNFMRALLDAVKSK